MFVLEYDFTTGRLYLEIKDFQIPRKTFLLNFSSGSRKATAVVECIYILSFYSITSKRVPHLNINGKVHGVTFLGKKKDARNIF